MQLDHDELVPDPQVCEELKIVPMTLWRWERDEQLNFPPKIKIRTRNYRSRRALNEFLERMVRKGARSAAAQVGSAPELVPEIKHADVPVSTTSGSAKVSADRKRSAAAATKVVTRSSKLKRHRNNK